MKHTYIILFLVICFSANAQIHIGAKGGVSIPNLEGNDEQSKGYTSRQGVYGGLLVNFLMIYRLSLQPEINFSPQGGRHNGMQQVPSKAIHGISIKNFLNTQNIINYGIRNFLPELQYATR